MYKFHHTLTPFLVSDTTRLFLATKEGDISLVETLLNTSMDSSYRTRQGQTLLYIAAQYGHESLVQLLLDRGLPADVVDENGVSPLYVAVKFGYKTITEKLIIATMGHERLLVDAFHCAIGMDNIDIVALLFTYNPFLINYHNPRNGYTALHVAVRYRHLRSMQWLLARGADLISKDITSGDAALALAVRYAYVGSSNELVDALLAAGVEPNISNNDGNTAGYYAAKNGNVDIMTSLIEHGLDIHHANHAQQTMLHTAADQGRYNMVKLLLTRQTSNVLVNQADRMGNTPLHAAAAKGHLETLYFLLMHGAQSNLVNQSQDAPLHLAVRYQHVEVVRNLLEHSLIHFHAKGRLNMMPLQESILNETWEITALLLVAYVSTQTEYDQSIMYPSSLSKWVNKMMVKKSLTNMVTNQLVRKNIANELQSFFGHSLSPGQHIAVELWWRMMGHYRMILLMLAKASPQNEVSNRPLIGHLPLEIRQHIAYYVFEEILPFHCLNTQSLVHGMGFLLEWLAAHSTRLQYNKPQPTARLLSLFGCSVFNPWINQERKIMHQRAEQVAMHVTSRYL